jgi:hypothetical protein
MLARRFQNKLDKQDEAKLRTWLNQKKCRCACCNSDTWGESTSGDIRISWGQQTSHTNPRSVIILMCDNCGHLAFFCPFKLEIGEELTT